MLLIYFPLYIRSREMGCNEINRELTFYFITTHFSGPLEKYSKELGSSPCGDTCFSHQ